MTPKLKRPPNAFFLYKKEQQQRIKKEYDCANARDVSVKAAELWRLETPQVRQEYEQKSKEMSEEFRLKNPEYPWGNRSRKSSHRDPPTDKTTPPPSPLPSPYLPFHFLSSTPQIGFSSPQDYYSPTSSYASPSGSITHSPMQMISSRMEKFSIKIDPQSLVDPVQFQRDFCIDSGELDEFGESEPLPAEGFDHLANSMGWM
jgi:hypothetical protein